MEKNLIYSLILMTMILGFRFSSFSQNQPLQHFEGSYLFQGKYPSGLHNTDWFPEDYVVQGVANDGSNWFFTTYDMDNKTPEMWKIPKGVDLRGDVVGNPGVSSIDFNNTPELVSINAWLWGDPDHYNHNGVDYILVPVINPQIIICFRADNLQYVNFGFLDPTVSPSWCAIGVDGALYTSKDDPVAITRYEVDWDKLVNQNNHYPFVISKLILLHKSDGTPLYISNMRGGEFSNSGEMIFLVSGFPTCLGGSSPSSPQEDGIHVIETYNWTEIGHSVNNSEPNNFFSLKYGTNCNDCDEGNCTHILEGLTVWDLEDGSAPSITGELHVLVDYYSEVAAYSDKLYFYHYSAIVHVDKNNGVDPPSNPLTGTSNKPFKKINAAYNFYPIWGGAQMVIKAGTYNDTGVFSTRIRMISEGGSAIIGQQ